MPFLKPFMPLTHTVPGFRLGPDLPRYHGLGAAHVSASGVHKPCGRNAGLLVRHAPRRHHTGVALVYLASEIASTSAAPSFSSRGALTFFFAAPPLAPSSSEILQQKSENSFYGSERCLYQKGDCIRTAGALLGRQRNECVYAYVVYIYR